MAAAATVVVRVALGVVLGAACLGAGAAARVQEGPGRIVSLIPATTEMLFAMGAGDRLVGVGSYDRFPPEVASVERVGGLLDPDIERIIALRPDLVIVYDTQVELRQQLDRAGIAYYRYEHRTLPDIAETLRALGQRVGMADRAEAVAVEMERALDDVRRRVAGRRRPMVLLVIAREPGSLRNLSASGGYGFLADLVDVAGGDNVFKDMARQSVQISTEMILARSPDVIVELRYGGTDTPPPAERPDAVWKALASVPAVRGNRIHVLTGDEFVVPGPRIVLAARRLAATLHP